LNRLVVSTAVAGFLIAIPQSAALSQETTNYSYDALGRLVDVNVDGGPADGSSAAIAYDDAGNRTSVTTIKGSPGVTCSLQTFNASSSDEFSAYAQISPVGSCPVNVTLSYTVTKQSGTGSWTVVGFVGGNILQAGEAYKLIRIDPTAYSVPFGQTLVLKVDWSATSGNATITPSSSTVTFYSSY
jgi:hypothetical protein